MGFLQSLFGGHEEGQGMAAQLISKLKDELSLTEDQISKMKESFHQFRVERKEAMAEGGEQAVEKVKEYKETLKNQISSLLSPEQKQKFMASMEKYKDFFHD